MYVINLSESRLIGTHCITLHVEASQDVTYFNSFGVEHNPKEIEKFIGNKNITENIFGIDKYN